MSLVWDLKCLTIDLNLKLNYTASPLVIREDPIELDAINTFSKTDNLQAHPVKPVLKPLIRN